VQSIRTGNPIDTHCIFGFGFYRLAPLLAWLLSVALVQGSESWIQYKFDARHSGNIADRNIQLPLGLVTAVPLSDAIFTAPVVSEGRVYAVDGSGVVYCLDGESGHVVWKVETRGGARNCNNTASPVLAGRYLHVGTTGGSYYVLDASDGKIVREIECGEPIFASPAIANDRVYFATLGGRIHALEADGTDAWTWDFVVEALKFSGNRWSGQEWEKFLGRRVTNREQFACSREFAVDGKTLVIPAGGYIVYLDDNGAAPKIRQILAPTTATLSLAIGEDGTAYRQSHWLDNGGQVEMLPSLKSAAAGAKTTIVPGTKTSTEGGLLSFCSVSLRGKDVYRCRTEENFAFCKHGPDQETRSFQGCYPSIAPPVLLKDKAVYGALDGALYVVSLTDGAVWTFKTAFGKAITAPVAVCDGRICFGCEDGYLYILGPDGKAALPTQDLGLSKIRSPLTGEQSDSQFNRFTSFADWRNSNATATTLTAPFKISWVRRFDGTAKHFSTFGEGRMYTHTAEGQIIAMEQETGRMLWRRYFPGVHISYTSPLYYDGQLLVPQAGLDKCQLRCLNAATGELVWEAPFAGSPSWNRQLPPVVCGNVAIYAFGTGRYGDEIQEEGKLPWLFEHQNVEAFPKTHHPLLRAYDLKTGREVWTKDFSEYGSGGDEAGVCLMDGKIYYSCFFGRRITHPGAKGLTAAIEPETGKVIWLTTEHSIYGGCTISAADGRLYLGGYNPLAGTEGRHIWCLDAKDGSLVWQSEPLREAIHVATIGPDFIFVHAQYKNGYLLDKATGKIKATLTEGYKCSRFTLCGSHLLGPAMDIVDVSNPAAIQLISSGPRMDFSECIGACSSNGRIYYTGHGGGLIASMVCGKEAESAPSFGAWK
jgi:outer membrane protein assembly factor BamB